MIGIHPERVTGDPQAVRWVIPAGTVAVGRVRRAPGRLGEMLSDGTLYDALSERGALWLWLRPGLAWRDVGQAVLAAIRDALADPGGWVVDPAPGDVLQWVTADLLEDSVGDFVRSHGGSVTAQRSGDDVVVRLGGACENCAAAEHTLRMRLVGELRRRCPDLVDEAGRGGEIRMRLG